MTTYFLLCFVQTGNFRDNDLEYWLRRDLVELMESPAISSPSLMTWVYLDQRNLQDEPYESGGFPINESLPLLYNQDGSPVPPEKYEGSRYLHYDHKLDKMVVDKQLPGERNSDNPQVMYDFMTHALEDCVSQATGEYFMIFSSHGSGFTGFGGDENLPLFQQQGDTAVNAQEQATGKSNPDNNLFRGRQLKQRNQRIVNAIAQALEDVEGAPDKLNVLGFDACLMTAIGAIDEYRDVAEYFLASEAVEPGHGWSFSNLDTTEGALDMAANLWFHYLNDTQARTEWGFPDVHDTPKTLAIVDTTAFSFFHRKWEALAGELLELLSANNDPNFHAALSRARSETLAFGHIDGEKSAVDIGLFLENLMSICNVDTSTSLFTTLDQTLKAYDGQFLYRGVGNGTAPATGMHVFWPLKSHYNEAPRYYNSRLFGDSSFFDTAYYNDDAPLWTGFLATYYNSTTPIQKASSSSVCLETLVSELQAESAEQLLLNPSVDYEATYALVQSEITIETDWVDVLYGMNMTHWVAGSERKLRDKAAARITPQQQRSRRPRHRRAQGTDYYYLFGGDAAVSYVGPVAIAAWDYHYYYLTMEDGLQSENIYVWDYGDDQRSFPVCYFPPSNVRTPDDLFDIIGIEEAKETLGCIEGEIYFTITPEGEASFNLYTNGRAGVPSEVPLSAGGQIAPAVFVELNIAGDFYSEILGGFNETLVDWQVGNGMGIIRVEDYANFELYGADQGIIDVYAHDIDPEVAVVDYVSFQYDFDADVDTDVGTSVDKGGSRARRDMRMA